MREPEATERKLMETWGECDELVEVSITISITGFCSRTLYCDKKILLDDRSWRRLTLHQVRKTRGNVAVRQLVPGTTCC